MHDKIRNAINSFTQEKNYAAGDKQIWIPQFKIGDKQSHSDMKSEEPILNYKVEDANTQQSKLPVYVQEYVTQSVLEVYAPPTNQASLKVQFNEQKDILIDDDEFFIALTHQQLEMTGVQLPLVVAKIDRSNWKKSE